MAEQLERARVANLSFYAVLALLAYFVFRVFEPFLAPLCWGGVFVVCLYALHERVAARVGPTAAATISTMAVALLIVVPAVAVATAFVQEASNAANSMTASLTAERFSRLAEWWQMIRTRIPGQQPEDLEALVKDGTTRAAALLATQAGGLLRDFFALIFDLVLMLFATFFLFRDADAAVDVMRRALPFSADRTERMLRQARDLIYASVIAGLAVAAVQGAVGGVAFAVLGIGAPVFWGVMMAFFSLIPVLGAWVIWVPAAIVLFVNGAVMKGIVLVAVGAGVVGLVDNVLRPMLLSGRSQMNGLLIFVSLLGGVSVFGLLGLVLGPVIIATAVTLFEAYTTLDDAPGVDEMS